MEKLEIPTFPSDITTEYLKSVLPHFSPIKCHRIGTLDSQGSTSCCLQICLEYEKVEPEKLSPSTVVFKYAKNKDENQKDEKLKMNDLFYHRLFESEILFYNVIHPQTDVKVPKIYYTVYENGKFVIIMEDFTKIIAKEDDKEDDNEEESHEYKAGYGGGSKIEVLESVKEISKLHKKYWHKNLGEKRVMEGIFVGNKDTVFTENNLGFVAEEFSWMFHIAFSKSEGANSGPEWAKYSKENADMLFRSFDDNVDEAMRNLGKFKSEFDIEGKVDEDFQKKLLLIIERKEDLKKYFRRAFSGCVFRDPMTLRHTDFRMDNIKCGEDGKVLGIFDWQTISIGSPFVDITSIVYTAPKPEEIENENYEEDVLKAYFETIGDEDLTFEEMKKLYVNGMYYEVFKLMRISMMIFTVIKNAPPMANLYKELLRVSKNIVIGIVKNIFSE